MLASSGNFTAFWAIAVVIQLKSSFASHLIYAAATKRPGDKLKLLPDIDWSKRATVKISNGNGLSLPRIFIDQISVERAMAAADATRGSHWRPILSI